MQLEEYLRNLITCRAVQCACEIVTNFLDRFNISRDKRDQHVKEAFSCQLDRGVVRAQWKQARTKVKFAKFVAHSAASNTVSVRLMRVVIGNFSCYYRDQPLSSPAAILCFEMLIRPSGAAAFPHELCKTAAELKALCAERKNRADADGVCEVKA